jgi:hypothetical protein
MKIDIKQLIGSELSKTLGYAILHAKKMYDVMINNYPAFGKHSGISIQPQVLHAVTEYAIEQNLSNWPGIKLTTIWNKRSYRFLEIVCDHFTMTISRVKYPHEVPRRADYRLTRTMRNQYFLFSDMETLPEGVPYLIFTHGLNLIKIDGQETNEELFCGIGMLNIERPTRWFDFVSLDEYIQPMPNIPEEEISERDLNALQQKIRRQIQANE